MKPLMKERLYRFAALALALSVLLTASAPAVERKGRDDGKLPFAPAEELVYEGELSKSLLRGINIAELRFKADRAQGSAAQPAGAQNPLHFTIEAQSKGLLIKLFKLNFRQRIESTVEPASFSVLHTSKLDVQNKRKRVSEAVFDRGAGKVVWTERDPNDPAREPRVVTNDAAGVVQDIASAFYYLRTQRLEPGKSFEILISDSGQVYRVPVAVTERKKMKTVLGEVQTVKVEPEIFGEGRLLRGKGNIAIWFTDDQRHVPVRAKINNEMGTLDIKLKSMTAGSAR